LAEKNPKENEEFFQMTVNPLKRPEVNR
jgi:hypothetical protein